MAIQENCQCGMVALFSFFATPRDTFTNPDHYEHVIIRYLIDLMF
jgi:hypothetical protein